MASSRDRSRSLRRDSDADFANAVTKIRAHVKEWSPSKEHRRAQFGLWDFSNSGNPVQEGSSPPVLNYRHRNKEAEGSASTVYKVPDWTQCRTEQLAGEASCTEAEVAAITAQGLEFQHLALRATRDEAQVLELEATIPASRYLNPSFGYFRTQNHVCCALGLFLDGYESVIKVQEIVHDPSMNIRTLFKVMRNLYEGLATLHADNITHGDIKSGNVMINRHNGEAMLIDFGLSSRVLTDDGLLDYNEAVFAKGWWWDPNVEVDDLGTSPSRKVADAGLMGNPQKVGKPADVFLLSATVISNLLLQLRHAYRQIQGDTLRQFLTSIDSSKRRDDFMGFGRHRVDDENDRDVWKQFVEQANGCSWARVFFAHLLTEPGLSSTEDDTLLHHIAKAMYHATRQGLADRYSARQVVEYLDSVDSADHQIAQRAAL